MRRLREETAVQAASELFLSNGIAAVKMTDIAAQTGIGVASLYRYFGTKTNLVVAAGTQLWRRFHVQFNEDQQQFAGEDGISRMRALLESYRTTFEYHAEFIGFLDDFDHEMLAEHVDRDLLREYDAEVMSFGDLFQKAYDAGVADGSIRPIADFPVFYHAIAHALMGIAQKLIRGEILPSDDFSQGSAELDRLVDMAIGYLRNGEAR
jgi:AcrR family transcriptional regulator